MGAENHTIHQSHENHRGNTPILIFVEVICCVIQHHEVIALCVGPRYTKTMKTTLIALSQQV
jgi:hypothetical protein